MDRGKRVRRGLKTTKIQDRIRDASSSNSNRILKKINKIATGFHKLSQSNQQQWDIQDSGLHLLPEIKFSDYDESERLGQKNTSL